MELLYYFTVEIFGRIYSGSFWIVKVSCFVQTLDNGECFSFIWSVAGFGCRRKPAANQYSFLPIITAEWFVRGWTLAVLLVWPETSTFSTPIGY